MKKAISFKQMTAMATALATAGLLSAGATAGTAAASSSAGSGVRATGSWWAYADEDFQGGDHKFTGTSGTCTYVGSSWNDSVNSARSAGSDRVELWENANCTGTAITIDDEGYSAIGDWVSAYRVTHP